MDELEQALRKSAGEITGGPAAPLAEAVGERAAQEGLLDVAYAQVDSPFGPLTVASTEVGLVLLAYPELPLDDVLGRLAERISPRVLEAPARLDQVRRELDAYFEGSLKDFQTPIDWRLSKGFYEKVLRATATLRYGETVTYREMAERAGTPAAIRAAGSGLGSNPIPVVVPCHRVLATGGGLGGYTGGLERKRFLLELELGPEAQLQL